MNHSTFSRVMTIGFLLALLYIGHGLHTNDPLLESPELTARVMAGDVTTLSMSDTDEASARIITTNEDGSVIRIWVSPRGSRQIEFQGEYAAGN